MTTGVVVLASALVYMRARGSRTNYDEGVYLASLDAMRRGQDLGRELYTSQPPVFYWLLRILAAPFGSSVQDIRFAFALLATLGVVAAAALAWRLYGPPAGVASGAFVAIAVPYPTFAATVAADVPAVVLGLVSLLLVTIALSSESPRPWAGAAGCVLALAMLTKLLAIPFMVPFVALACAAKATRRVLPTAALGGALVASLVALASAGSIGDLWRQIVTDHSDARNLGTFSGNLDQISTLFEPRTPFGWLAPLGFVAFILSKHARPTWPLWTFVPAAGVFLVLVRPLTDHHLLLLSVACAISAGPSLALAIGNLNRIGQVVATSVLVAFVAAGLYQEQRRLERNDLPDPPEVRWAVEAVERATAPDHLVVSDQPIVLFRTGRATVGQLVDISNTRVSGGTLTADDVNREILQADPDAVLVNRMLRSLPPVIELLDRTYGWRVRCGSATLYLRVRATTPPCPV